MKLMAGSKKGVQSTIGEELSTVVIGESKIEVSADGKRVTAYADGVDDDGGAGCRSGKPGQEYRRTPACLYTKRPRTRPAFIRGTMGCGIARTSMPAKRT